MPRLIFLAGTIAAGLGVMLGAFGAHALANSVTEARLGTFETGVRYQMYHALALLFVGWLMVQQPSVWVQAAALLFVVGIFLFSGSLYALVLTDVRWLGMITPLGGVAFVGGWSCLFVALWKSH